MSKLSPLAAAESAQTLRDWLREHAAPPTVRAAVQAEVIRLLAIAHPTPLPAHADPVAECERLRAIVVEREAMLAAELDEHKAQLVELAGNYTTRTLELCTAIDNADARPQFDGRTEMPSANWETILVARAALTEGST